MAKAFNTIPATVWCQVTCSKLKEECWTLTKATFLGLNTILTRGPRALTVTWTSCILYMFQQFRTTVIVIPFTSINSDPHHLVIIVTNFHSNMTSGFRGEVTRSFSTIWPCPSAPWTIFKYKNLSSPLGDHCDQVSPKSDQWFQRRSC